MRRSKRSGGKRSGPKRKRGGRRGGRGTSYETSSTRRRRTPTRGRCIGSLLKGIGKFAAKNAPTILKGVRYMANKSGNKTIKALANSDLLDQSASAISKKFGGRGSMKSSSVKKQAKDVVRKLIKVYGEEGARKILRSYMKTIRKLMI